MERTIYVIEMWDDQFGWVRCMDGLDVPMCYIKRVTAKARIQQLKEKNGGRFQIVRYQPVPA